MPLKGRIVVNEAYCKGCELCVAACPQEVLALSIERITAKGYHPAELAAAGCTGCGICAVVCPEAAIEVYREALHRESTGRTPAEARANQEDRNAWPVS